MGSEKPWWEVLEVDREADWNAIWEAWFWKQDCVLQSPPPFAEMTKQLRELLLALEKAHDAVERRAIREARRGE